MNPSLAEDTPENAALLAVMQQQHRIRHHYQEAPERFLVAWKKAIDIIGPTYFHCQGIDSYHAATSREQLRPNSQAIENYLGVCSIGQGVFIGAVVSFFNGDWGAEICTSFGYAGLGDIANRLELNELEVIVELMLNHTGW